MRRLLPPCALLFAAAYTCQRPMGSLPLKRLATAIAKAPPNVCRAPGPSLTVGGRQRIAILELSLVPVRIRNLRFTRLIQLGHLFGCECEARRSQVVAQLLFVARADDHGGDGRFPKQPVQSQLRHTLTRFGGKFLERVHDPIKVLILHLRAGISSLVQAAHLRQRLAAADLAREAPPTQRTPHQGAYTFRKRLRHQLPLVVAAHERIVDLVTRIARAPIALTDPQGLLKMPAGKIRRRDITQLAYAYRVIQGSNRLFNRSKPIEGVHMIDVDIVGLQPLQASVDLTSQMTP